jgi:hypothetical protein
MVVRLYDPRCAGPEQTLKNNVKNNKIELYKTPSFRQAPECPLLFHHNGRVAGALKGLSVLKIIFIIF